MQLVVMAVYGQEEDRHKSRATSFDHYLVKPADLTEINRLLADAARS